MAEKHIPGQPFPCPGAMLNPGRAPDGGECSLLSLGGDEDLLIGLQTLQDLGEVGGVWCHLSTPTPKLVLDFNGLAEKYVIFGLVELFLFGGVVVVPVPPPSFMDRRASGSGDALLPRNEPRR